MTSGSLLEKEACNYEILIAPTILYKKKALHIHKGAAAAAAGGNALPSKFGAAAAGLSPTVVKIPPQQKRA